MACRGVRLLEVQHAKPCMSMLLHLQANSSEGVTSLVRKKAFQIINSVQFSVEYNSSTLLYFCSSMLGKWVWYIL
uniref:Uncharacterized protein n=1 Tax=Aegilops tauschii subsp. strangulata TaxID=200361 RepID=A0A453KSB3_AEGTS